MNLLRAVIPGIRSILSIKRAYDNDFRTVPIPTALTLETTYACTCKCVFCSRWIEGPKHVKEELTYSEMVSLIDQSRDLGVRAIDVTGGEPLIRKDILNAMQYARRKGMLTTLSDNGTLVNEDNARQVLASFDVISISLDSLIRKKHDEIRGVSGTFDKTIRSIELLRKYAQNTEICVVSVLTAENVPDLLEINQEFSKKGIRTLFQPVQNGSGNGLGIRVKKFGDFSCKRLRKEYLELLKNRSWDLVDRIILKKYYTRAFDFVIDPKSTKDCFNCFAGSYSFFVNPYGDVYPCEPLRISMGNIRRESLERIWYDPRSSELRRRIKNRNCNCWFLCSAPPFIFLSRLIN